MTAPIWKQSCLSRQFCFVAVLGNLASKIRQEWGGGDDCRLKLLEFS